MNFLPIMVLCFNSQDNFSSFSKSKIVIKVALRGFIFLCNNLYICFYMQKK